jgi:inner membrane protein
VDPLAHTLVGAALARTGLGRDRPLALPVMVLAANAPDVDVAAYLVSSDAALAFRRGLTHGPLGLAILPLAVTAMVWWVNRRWSARGGAATGSSTSSDDQAVSGAPAGAAAAPAPIGFPSLLALAYLAALTHPALDWLNTYGVRLLYPFDRRWFYGDTLFIVDPWVWLVLGAGVVLGHRIERQHRRAIAAWTALALLATALLVTASDSTATKVLWIAGVAMVAAAKIAGLPRREIGRRRAATASVAVFAAYVALAIGGALAARAAVRSAIADAGGGPVEQLMVGPLPATVERREVVAATATEIRYGRFRWLGKPRFEWSDWSRPRPPAVTVPSDASDLPPRAVLDAALRDPSIRGFVGWVRFLYAEIDEHPGEWEVHLMDARYTLARGARFGSVVVRVPRAGAPTSER